MRITKRLNSIFGLDVLTFLVLGIFIAACANTANKPNSSEPITDLTLQAAIFEQLISFTNTTIPTNIQNDSMAFLILPVEASCPSCRKKTIDSIIKHKNDLPYRHYIIISATGGRKLINSFFKEQDYILPEIPGRLFIDSTHQGDKYRLFKDNPAIYYTNNRRAYLAKKAIPATIRDDLREYFSGIGK